MFWEKNTLCQLLKNPMLLLMYKQVCPVMDHHRDTFLEWMDPIENATQLIHNFFVAQEAVLLERGDILGEHLVTAMHCIGYALPYIGYYFEVKNCISMHRNEFDTIVDRAVKFANQCNYLNVSETKLCRQYRVRTVPEVSLFDVEDYLIKVMHLLHEDDESFISFSHQMYRDYLSAVWLSKMYQSDIEAMWNQRYIPGYMHGYLRELNENYWDGIAMEIAERARNRESGEIKKLLTNLLYVFPYTKESGTPDFSNIDFTGVRLQDYIPQIHRIPMAGAKINAVSLALINKEAKIYHCLGFSEDGTWLAGVLDGVLHIWSMVTGTATLVYSLPEDKQVKNLFFAEDGQYMFAVSNLQSRNFIDIFCQNFDDWTYCGTIMKIGFKKLHNIIIVGKSIYFYYNNRVRIYSLLDGSLIENRAEQHAWENRILGTDIYEELIKTSSAQKINDSLDGAILHAVSRNKEFSAFAYNDGSLIVFRYDELYLVLERGVARLKAAAVSGNGKRAVTLSQQIFGNLRRVQLWDLETKHRNGECFVRQDIVNIHLTESGEWIIGEQDGAYKIWRWDNVDEAYILKGKLISNQHGKLTTHGNKVLHKNSKNVLEVFDLESRESSAIENLHKDVRIADFLPNGELVVVGNNVYKAVLHSIRDGKEISLNSESSAVTGIFCMKSQPFVGLATANKKLCFYHTGTGQRTRILETTSGNKIIVGHRSKDVVACSGGRKQFETFNYYSFKSQDGRKAGRWYKNPIDKKFYGDVLDMDFNATNEELVTIMSDGLIVYSHEKYCKYHDSTWIITNFSVDAYDFTGVICNDEIRNNLISNGAKI